MTRDSLRQLILEYQYSPDEVATMARTARRAGAVGAKALVPRYVQSIASPGDEILDFGAGAGAHAERLNAAGLNVTPYDLGFPRDTDGDAMSRTYDIVYASNVLNVQHNQDALTDLVQAIYDRVKPGGTAVMNYPATPRYSDLTADDVESVIGSVFGSVERASGYGDRKAPVFVARR